MLKLNKTISKIEEFFIEIGELTYFGGRFFKELFSKPFEFKELLRQCYNVGNRSLLLVGITGFNWVSNYITNTTNITRIWC